ncbi:hypothetical protein M6B22_07065 [Jatrophihabitans cynanchi]|uniref:Uncharacterized protein n=1 Tax=Jatrophihabitans cynanchi TaxID=2944128 RepID=A0ABY7K4Q1_9ACTN|nr:hypothetical protein [Jatrophihabitans sp. SB3-54]WAX58517.1 hypothetical protein M6B22_07065 [Jatrophihabitans sp. SB3-54]
MTSIDPADRTERAGKISHAAALLDAVARDSEQAVDFDVPLRCGRAAGRLHAVLGFTPAQLPFVGDDVADIGTAIAEATAVLSSLPDDELTDPVLDAILDARAAADALPQQAVQ